MSSTAVDIGTLIESRPEHYGGWPCLARTGYPVALLAVYHNEQGYSPEQILEQQEHLTLGEIYAGLAYYLLNKEQVDADLEQSLVEFEELCAANPDHVWTVD